MNDVFMSYRREDSAAICGRIFESLERYLGRGAIFKDVDSIPYGVSFPDYLSGALEKCSVILVVIGRHWLQTADASGRRRLDDPNDFVRVEAETALRRRDIVVLPLLVEGATMPPAEQLPPSLRPLTQLNAAIVRNDPDYQGDIQRVQSAVQALLRRSVHASTLMPASSVDVSKYAPRDGGSGTRGVLIALGTLVLLAAIAIPVVLARGLLSAFSGFAGVGSSSQHTAVQTTITHFCRALHDGDNATAYSYLSPHYQLTITSASDLPKKASDPFGAATDCAEGQSGNLFTADDSTTAHDYIALTVDRGSLGNSTITKTVKFVKSGSTWQIDSMA